VEIKLKTGEKYRKPADFLFCLEASFYFYSPGSSFIRLPEAAYVWPRVVLYDASHRGVYDSMMAAGQPFFFGANMGQPAEVPLLRVDIVSDVVCPWCIIGYKQLMKALENMPGQFEVAIHWHPFELNPQMPAQGQDLREHVAQKYGTDVDQSRVARDRLSALGDALGFTFDYFDGMRMVNTFRAHQLLNWADGEGLQTALKLALFDAFFSLREDVNDVDLLAEVAGRVGLDKALAKEVIADERFAQTVRQEEKHWLEQEVHAVPTFFFQQQYRVAGAQEAEAFVRVLEKIQSKGAL
jgi:predicted DsbA family dithiol-disulfide isomerase